MLSVVDSQGSAGGIPPRLYTVVSECLDSWFLVHLDLTTNPKQKLASRHSVYPFRQIRHRSLSLRT